MTLEVVYKQFLAAPSSSYLADDATLHYITTTTTFKGATDIIKHLGVQRHQVKKTKEDVLTAVEGHAALAVELDTAFEFVLSGGTYLPGLDDNFLADRAVNIPIMHIVTFGADGRILQIRQSWDQGVLLKQVDVIGKSGRNWPIRDSKDQIKMIANCATSASEVVPSHNGASCGGATKNGSFSLFGSRDENTQSMAAVVSPKGGPRPAQRGFADILGDNPSGEHAASVISPKAGAGKNFRASRIFDADEDQPVEDEGGSPSAGRGRNQFPSKAVPPKAGVAKKFQPNRLFDTDGELIEEDEESVRARSQSPGSVIAPKAGANKKFGASRIFDANEPDPDAPRPTLSTGQSKPQHQSQWSFDDFVTPAKAIPTRTLQRQEDTGEKGTESEGVARPHPRHAQQQFEFLDDAHTPGPSRKTQIRPRGAAHNTGMGLYTDNVLNDEADGTSASDAAVLGNVTNLKDRSKTFNSQFNMTDSPGTPQARVPLGEDRKKAVKMMDSNWEAYDVSPAQKENRPAEVKPKGGGGERGIHIGGDGMGGSKGTRRDWLFGDGDETPPPAKTTVKSGGFSWDF